MEMPVYTRLQEYEEMIGVPPCPMPEPDGKDGLLPEAVIPEEWIR